MKITKSVIYNNYASFKDECDSLLNDGWNIIPGTVSVSTSVSCGDGYIFSERNLLVAFFEKESTTGC